MRKSPAGASNPRRDSNGVSRAVGKPRGRRRDRDCQSCKQRGVKCDLNRPSCGECIAAGIPCRGYSTRVVWMGSAASSSSVNPRPRTADLNAAPVDVPGGDPLLSASTTVAARPATASLSGQGFDANDDPHVDWTGTDRNSFIGPLVALCQDIIRIDGEALGKGTNHYLSPEAVRLISRLRDFAQARIDTHPTPADDSAAREIWESDDAARYRLDALVGLKETLAVANPFALIGIAAFAFFEVWDSGFRQWQRHLVGAKSLLDYHCTCREELERLSQEVTGLTAMVARLIWFDTTGAIIRGTSDMIFEQWHREMLDDRFFRIVGCSADTFHLFSRLAAGEMVTNSAGLFLGAMDQLLKLDQGDTDWDRSADAYRCAAVVAILSQARDSSCLAAPTTDMVSSAVDRTCRILVSLSATSQYYIHLAVPAYLAGINATSREQCDVVRGYWHNCTHARVRRYPDGLARCEARWKENGLVA